MPQDDGYDVVVAVVRRVGLHFSILLCFLGMTKVGLVQDTCKYEMYSGVAIFQRSQATTTSWAVFLLNCY